ncbi:hypothetical protein PDJAM_G00238030 [Pangasius djambal]|uniref:Uncharacterized protein n=1 Tax=Pangasius djambal TaxID=1691987 RepID=A0ACC5YI92_9TELE|nr:hypothetical protein [Pangasius djambal]
MPHLRSVLVCLSLLVSICQANTGSLRTSTSTSTQGKGLLTNALVGLGAVAGFLFIVFVILIVKRVFFKKDKDEKEPDPEVCGAYENKALELETPAEAKTTNL